MMCRLALALLLALLGAAGPCLAGMSTLTAEAETLEVTSLWETGYCGGLMQVRVELCTACA